MIVGKPLSFDTVKYMVAIFFLTFGYKRLMQQIEESKKAQYKLSEKDLQRVEVLKELTGEQSGTQILMTALELTELVIKNMKCGNQIAIEYPDKKEYIRIR